MNFANIFNILNWLPNYKREYLKSDISAGLTVGVMLIPQGMAYAIIAGLPPVFGLYAALVPIIIYALLGTSRQLAVGPVAMDSLLVASFIGTLAKADSEHYISLAILLAMMMGIIQLLLGIFRMGFLVNFLSKPVISGFTSAAAIIIGFSQLKHLLGTEVERSNQIQNIALNVADKIDDIHLLSLTIGVVAIIIIKAIKKFSPKIPAPLVVVILGTAIVWILNLHNTGIKIVGVVPDGLPAFKIPNLDFALVQTLFPMAATLALVAFMEAISISKAVQAKHNNYELKPNNELIALGAANFIGSLFQSYPTTGGFSRTAVNDQSGAKTPLASLISASLIGLTLLFLTPLFYYLPKAVLGAIIMVAVLGLVDIKYPFQLWKINKMEFLMLFLTFITTLTIGITIGIAVGVASSIVLMVFLSTKPHIAVLGQISETNQFRNVKRFDDLEIRDEVLIIRFDAQMYFANAQYLKDKLNKLIREKQNLQLIVINMESVPLVDSTAINVLSEIHKELSSKQIEFCFAGTIGPVRDVLERSGFSDQVGKENFFLDIHFALMSFDNKKIDASVREKASQTNN